VWIIRSASERFDVVYHLLSMHQNHRIRVRVIDRRRHARAERCAVWPAANWFEREAFDCTASCFRPPGPAPHPHRLRFEGHPLRKDFPLTGNVEVRYDDEKKKVVYEPVQLVQEFRNFDFLSPWEGMTT
jgi:NADH-quinone oxidoreductase subunit C